MSSDKVIFLDIDGVMIPGTQLLIDRMSTFTRKFPATTIAALNEMCERTQAKIVFNSTHNQHWDEVPDIEDALVAYGLKSEYLHPTDLRTAYPRLRRPQAIQDWLSRHPEVEDRWVAVDDAKCAEDGHMVLVYPSGGLDVDNVNQAIGILGGQMIIMML